MDFSLSEEHLMIRDAAREFAKTELLPGVIERDEQQHFPKELIKKMLYQGGQLQTKCSTKVGSFKQNESRSNSLLIRSLCCKTLKNLLVSDHETETSKFFKVLQQRDLSNRELERLLKELLYQGGQSQKIGSTKVVSGVKP